MNDTRCFAASEDGYLCTREDGHPFGIGHAAPTGGPGNQTRTWVSVPDGVVAGVDRCQHGVLYGFDPDAVPIAWAGGTFYCECCRQTQFYIGSSMMSWGPDGHVTGHQTVIDTTHCKECGGEPTHVEQIDYWSDGIARTTNPERPPFAERVAAYKELKRLQREGPDAGS